LNEHSGRDADLDHGKPSTAASDSETREPLAAKGEARALALAIAGAGLEKKALGVEIIDVCGKVDYTEFLVLMTGRSDRHVHAIARGVEDDMRSQGTVPMSVEGLTACTWVLLDFNDVVVHVFQKDARSFYDLEGLWIDASRVDLPGVDLTRRTKPPSKH
jgi:ribosome-associated protein